MFYFYITLSPWSGHTIAAGLAAAAVVPQPGVAVLVRAALAAVGPRLGDVLADGHVPAHHHLSCYRGVSVRDGSEGPRSFHSAYYNWLVASRIFVLLTKLPIPYDVCVSIPSV